jgi:NADH-quinone oxidoreductase subunit G
VNQSWLCDRGRFGFEAVEAPERLTKPLVRSETGLAQATWNEALSVVADRILQTLQGSGPGAVGVIGGSRLANEDAYAWVRLVKGVICTDNFDAQLGDGLPAELVASLPRATIEETVAAGTVIVLAGDLREELPVLHLRLRQAAANEGLRIIDCSPVATGLSEVATWLPYRPGEASELARALVVTEPGDGVVIVLGRPSLAESAAEIAAAANVFAAAWPSARFLSALRRGNVHGAIDLGCAPGLLPGRVTLDEGRALFGEHWGSVPAGRGLDTAGMLEAAASGELNTLVLLGADPLSDFPDRDLATRALERVDFLVAVDTALNASSMLADVVLPAAGYAERGGTTTNLEGRVTRLAAKIVPPGVSRADWVIATELADRLGADLGFESLEGIWAEIETIAPAHSGCTVTALAAPEAADGIVIPLRAASVQLTRRPRRLDPIATPGIDSVSEQGAPFAAGAAMSPGVEPTADGEAFADEEAYEEEELFDKEPAPAAVAVPGGNRQPSLLRFDPGAWAASAPLPSVDGRSWRLVVRRGLYDHGTLVQSAESLAPLARSQELRLAPHAMTQLGVEPGDEVRVRSPRGELVVAAAGDAGVPSGVALLQFNAAPVHETSASALIDSSVAVVEVDVEKVT